MTSDSAGAVMKLPRRVYSRNSEASVSNDGKIQGFVFVSFLFLSSVITFDKKCANSTQRSQSPTIVSAKSKIYSPPAATLLFISITTFCCACNQEMQLNTFLRANKRYN